MAKKPVQFRFDENFHKQIQQISNETGQTVSEIVRNSINLYLAIYSRTKGRQARFIIEEKDTNNSYEVILPWLLS